MGSTQPAGAQGTSGDVGDPPKEERPQLSLGAPGTCTFVSKYTCELCVRRVPSTRGSASDPNKTLHVRAIGSAPGQLS